MHQLRYALLPMAMLVATPLSANIVVLVTDVAGKVLLDGRMPVNLMDGLEARRTLVLAAKGKLALLDLSTGVESVFLGPCQFRLDAKGQPQGARAATSRGLASAQGALRLKPESLAPAGVLMRGAGVSDEAKIEVDPLGPVVLADRPLLTWKETRDGSHPRFRLYDGAGTIVLEAMVEGTSIRLPALTPGKPYTWVLETRKGKLRIASGAIRLLEEPARSQLAQLPPPQGATFSERLVYAALLEDLGLRAEAHPWWQALAKERPNDQRLQGLARH